MNTRTTVFALGLSLLAGAAIAQPTLRASADNRTGQVFAWINGQSADPVQTNYNIDPSEIYRTWGQFTYPASQTFNGFTATASLTTFSAFENRQQAAQNAISGFSFRTNASCSAVSGSANNLTAQSNFQDRLSVGFTTANVSAATPLRLRIRGNIEALTGGATAQVQLTRSGGASLFNATTVGAFDTVITLTTGGDLNFLGLSQATLSRSAPAATLNATARVNARVHRFCSYADVASLGGGQFPDAALTADDVTVFLQAFFAGNLDIADLVQVGGTRNPDGRVTADDIIFFLGQFFGGCA